MSQEKALITLDQAKQLVRHIEADESESANAIIHAITVEESAELYSQVGKLTRQVHNSLSTFNVNNRIYSMTSTDMPDARSRLEFVISETEKAANSTMDSVEKILPTAEKLSLRLATIMPEWKKLMSRQIELGEFKHLCLELDELLCDASNESKAFNTSLTDVLMAQGYQDITGQVIRRVIDIVKEVEDHLVDMLGTFGEHERCKYKSQSIPKKDDKERAEGPIIDAASRDDVLNNQDDVDDLLSSLGF
jgi:chemotaxis protein CheZ